MKNKSTIMMVFLLLFANMLFAQELDNLLDDQLPADYPAIMIKNVDKPAPGYYFLANPAKIANFGNFCMIVDNEGITKSYKRTRVRGYDFNMQSNGLFSYADAVLPKGWFWANVVMYVTDENLAVVDSFQCGNGYQADMHEFKWLPNGHVFMLSQDPQYVDLSKYFKGGNPNALVAGTIIQELDSKKNVIFQWRSWDHLDLSETYEDTLQATVNPFHFNALDIDRDGNILVSVRHTCQIIKINRKTGEIMWRLGGKKNQFAFINDYEPINKAYFSHQHNIKVLPNGNITFYDNGWIRNPQFSRGVEYKIDAVNKTATKVWEYRHTPDIYTELMGSVQRLSNGNTVICWAGPNPEGRETLTEVHPDNTIALEMTLPPLFACYRVYKYELPACQPTANVSLYEIMQGNTYNFKKGTTETRISMTLDELSTFIYNNITVTKYSCSAMYPKFEGKDPISYNVRVEITSNEIDSSKTEISFDLSQFPEVLYPEKTIVYKRDTIGVGYFQPMVTTYDASTNKLTINSKNFGEYILGWLDTLSNEMVPPTLITPLSGAMLNISKPVKLSWTNNGMALSNNLQISDDIQFSNIIYDSVLKTSVIEKKSLSAEKQLYWRVRARYDAEQSPWSNLDSFMITQAFLKIQTPNGGESIERGATNSYIIRWKDNLQDSVKIEFVRNNFDPVTIVEKFLSYTEAYLWQIKTDLPLDSTYRIRITNLKNKSITSTSENYFSIVDKENSVNDPNLSKYQLDVSPNPATNKITISLNNDLLPFGQDISISIFDNRGIEIKRFTSSDISAQSSINYSTVGLPSGVYYCTLNIGANTITKSFLVVR